MLRKVVFTGGNVDPCLYTKKNKKVIVCIALYLDDNLLIGNSVIIDETMELF